MRPRWLKLDVKFLVGNKTSPLSDRREGRLRDDVQDRWWYP
jgi:hypothetical protein